MEPCGPGVVEERGEFGLSLQLLEKLSGGSRHLQLPHSLLVDLLDCGGRGIGP